MALEIRTAETRPTRATSSDGDERKWLWYSWYCTELWAVEGRPEIFPPNMARRTGDETKCERKKNFKIKAKSKLTRRARSRARKEYEVLGESLCFNSL